MAKNIKITMREDEIVALDNAAREAIQLIEAAALRQRALRHAKEIGADRIPRGIEQMKEKADAAIAEYHRIAEALGAPRLAKASAAADEDPDLADDHRDTYRGLRRRIEDHLPVIRPHLPALPPTEDGAPRMHTVKVSAS